MNNTYISKHSIIQTSLFWLHACKNTCNRKSCPWVNFKVLTVIHNNKFWFNNRYSLRVVYLFSAVFFLIISSSLLLKASTFSKTAIRWSLVEMLEAWVIVPKICAMSISCRTSFLLVVPITSSLRPLSLIREFLFKYTLPLINHNSNYRFFKHKQYNFNHPSCQIQTITSIIFIKGKFKSTLGGVFLSNTNRACRTRLENRGPIGT